MSNCEDKFAIFDQLFSPEALTTDFGHLLPTQAGRAQEESPILEDMGIQCQQRTDLLEVMEPLAGGKVPEKPTEGSQRSPLKGNREAHLYPRRLSPPREPSSPR